MRIMRPLVVVLVLAGCGHSPPPKAAAVERPVKAVGDIAGNWVSSDDMDWSYRLALDPAGTIELLVDRNKMGKCAQRGTLTAGEAPQQFQLTYKHDECNRDYNGAALQLKVESFTGDSLTIAISGYGGQERHVFTRAPSVQ